MKESAAPIENSPAAPGRETRPGIHRKTTEELRLQHGLSSRLDRDYSLPIPKAFTDMELPDILAEVDKIKKVPREELKHEEISLLYNWTDYVNSLRKLRALQIEQIKEALNNAPPEERRQTYLEAVTWSSPVQQKFLAELQKRTDEGGSGKRLFTDDRLAEAAKTEEGFIDLLDDLIELNPSEIMMYCRNLEDILPRERLIPLLDKVFIKDPSAIASNAVTVRKLYGDEKFKQMFFEACDKYADSSFIWSLRDENVRNLIGHEESKRIITKCIEKSAKYSRNAINAELVDLGLVDKDLLSRELVVAVRAASSYHKVSEITHYWEFFGETEREECRTIARQVLADNEIIFTSLDSLSGILGDDEIASAARKVLMSDEQVTLYSWSDAEKYLGSDFEAWAAEVMEGKRPNIEPSDELCKKYLNSGTTTPEEKERFLERICEGYPWRIFYSADEYLQHLSEEERCTYLAKHVDSVDVKLGLHQVHLWLPVTAKNEAGQKEALISYMLSSGDLDFFEVLQGTSYKEKPARDYINSLLKTEDIKHVVLKAAELSPDGCFGRIKETRDILGGDNELKAFLDEKRQASPGPFLEKLGVVIYLYSPQEILAIIEESIGDPHFSKDIIHSIESWAPKIGQAKTMELLMPYAEYFSTSPFNLDIAVSFLPEEAKKPFLKKVAEANPASTVYLSRTGEVFGLLGYPIDLDNFKKEAATKGPSGLAPKSVGEFWKKFDPYGDLDEQKQTILGGISMYNLILYIEKSGLGELHKKIYSAESIDNTKAEIRLLHSMSACIRMKSMGFLDVKEMNELNTLDDVEKTLFHSMLTALQIEDSGISNNGLESFVESMGTVSPFVIYLSQYYKSAEHRKILSEMFLAVCNGKFSEWKYGGQDGFEKFREKRWLPEKLTAEQYALWQKDGTTDLYESLQASADTTVKSIRKIFSDNVHHTNSIDLNAMTDETGESMPDLLTEIKTALKANGMQIGEVKKQISQMKADGKADTAEFNDLLRQKESAEKMREELGMNRDIVRLCMLSTEEISSGYIIDGDKKTQRISTMLDGLKKIIGAEGMFVIGRVEDTIANFKSSGAEKQNIIAVDSSDPKIMLEIGGNPVESCQHYQSGSENDCLLGYSEANTKIIVVKNEKGVIIARSILRLLEDHEGKPELQMEQIYSTSASQGVNKAILEHATRKATALNVPLRAAKSDIPEDVGFKGAEHKAIIYSKGARAPKVYVDSAGGAKSFGRYKINNLARVERTERAAA